MTPERWRRVGDIFQRALDEPSGARGAFVEHACGADAELRREVLALIDAHRAAPGFLASATRAGLDAVPEAAPVLPSGARLGPYEVAALIARGGMGEVYEALDPRLGRRVAVKVLARHRQLGREAVRRLEREARAAAALSHPGILAVYDVGVADDMPYVVSELLEGETLRDALRRGPWTWREAAERAREIADALAEAHAKGFAHRDVKPENLFLTRDGRIKILDFGLARPLGLAAPSDGDDLLTLPGAILGTVGYMSPEQVRGDAADARSDVFSFGAVLYEALAGRRAFSGASAVETLNAILVEEPAPLPRSGLPPALEAIVLRCLRKRPDERYASGRELVAALDSLLAGALAATEDLAAVEPVAAVKRIAVLPFANLSGDPDQDFFCVGLAEELSAGLDRIEGVRVAAPVSTLRLARNQGARQVGRELGVDVVLEGSVRRAGDRLRITARLVDVAGDVQLWSERFERRAGDVFALQDEIAARVLAALRLRLDTAASPERRPTADVEAYMLYLRGSHLWNKRHGGGLRDAAAAFEAAVARDPGFAQAHAGLAECHALLGNSLFEGRPARESLPLARGAARRALDIDPGLAAAHAALGWVALHYDWDWAAAETAFRRALELEPRRAMTHHWYGFLHSALGRAAEAMDAARRAWELDPLSLIINAQLCQAHYYAGRFEDTERAARNVLAMEPGFPVGHYWLGVARLGLGRFAEAIPALEACAAHGGGRARTLALQGLARARMGEPEEARAALLELEARAADGPGFAHHCAVILVGLGANEAAIDRLEQAVEERTDQVPYLAVDPVFVPLHREPRFARILGRLRLPFSATPRSAAERRAEATRLYEQSRLHLQRESVLGVVAGLDALEKARRADPEFAPAWAGLAVAYARLGFISQPDGDWHARAQEMCEKALSLDPQLPEGLYARARLRWSPKGGFDHAGAIADLVAALRLQPELHEARVRLASVLNHVGLIEPASALLERVLRDKPGHPNARYQQAMCLFHAGRYDGAFDALSEIARSDPDLGADSQIASCALRLGRLEEAARFAELGARLDADAAFNHTILALVEALRDDEAAARDRLRLAADAGAHSFGHYHHAQYEAACALAQLSDAEAGLDWLEAAAGNGYPCLTLFESDTLLAPLRSHERYRSLVARIRDSQRMLVELVGAFDRGTEA